MTIRGGGNPNSAMAAMPLGEWTRRLGALPAEAYDCFMVETPCGFNRIQAWFARLLAANGRLPSDHRGRPPDHGQPAIGREQSREPRLYSVEPTWGLDHEAVIRFCGQGSEAAGPVSHRHRSHIRIRISATSDRHRLPGSSNAVRCRTLFVLSRSRVLPTRVLLTPPAATRHRPAPHRS